MKIHPFYGRVLRYLEPLPADLKEGAQATMLERSQLRVSHLITSLLRRSRGKLPMVWDPWILKDGDLYRMFYLQGIAGQTPWWFVSNIGGAISTDLEHWKDLGTLLEPNPNQPWEAGRVCAGCAYKEDGIYYLFYSAGGTEMPHLKNEGIGLAVSQDGVKFERVSDRPLLIPDETDPWYARCNSGGHFHWRDPYVFKERDKYYLFICASVRVPGDFQGSVGIAVAERIEGPYKILPPAIDLSESVLENWFYYHLERPQVIYRDGKYHLFFSCFKQFFNRKWLKTQQRVTNSSLYWYISDRVTGPYKPIDPDNFIVKGSEKTGIYGTNFLQISTDPEEFIAYGWYHRLHALEVSKTFRVKWDSPGNTIDSLTIY
ncbi:glycoside hydrolase family 68 protein [Leptolyngbya sp. NIES-2104]|uniref:glycoside hydrolase family 68 protein n=1 Tax=Leptolyngbya sp. NIES-2104 TaxID=1552121 RepID=UPI0006EC5320|nr:glycoside hydrolase family 68 protein [Leptolyngbya sp. NIES-2104]GAP97174.1 sucrose-6-phosphate hydrolase [Leptolyngbya sp. NIES-2104]